jgi:hypothetical protein
VLDGPNNIRKALGLVGSLLLGEGVRIRIVVIGGAALNLRGIVSRVTTDVDVVAFATGGGARVVLETPPVPLPAALVRARERVAQELGLGHEWLNSEPADLLRLGLPEGAEGRLDWEVFGGLEVGVLHPDDLVPLKLYAAAHEHWTGRGRHYGDLVALRPTIDVLEVAKGWVERQDPSDALGVLIRRVIEELTNEAK